MKLNKKYVVIFALSAVVTLTVAATSDKKEPNDFKNLKVLPKNISSHDLQSIMADDFDDGLGVSCGFCHSNNKDGHGLDFASDAKPEKAIARKMILMTMKINKKFFGLKHPVIGAQGLTVTCETCHKGAPFPGDAPK